MKQERITIVVPIYNVEKYLDRCLKSIVSQTYRNLEIILVDDGSPDACPGMCDRWAQMDERIKVIHQENAGLGMARNTGINHASGNYICFFDSDDYVKPDTVQKAYDCAKALNAEIVVFGISSVDKNGKITEAAIPKGEDVCYRGDAVQSIFLPDLVDSKHKDVNVRNLCLSACCCLISMDLVRKTGWQFVSERQNISEDSYSLIWLYKYVNAVAIMPEAPYCYCENETSLTRTYRPDRFNRIKQFYLDTLQMAKQQGYKHVVQDRIAGLLLSLTISAMKQIVVSDMKFCSQMELITKIVSDDLLQQILHTSDCRSSSRARNIILWAIRRKACHLVFLLVKAQTCVGRKQ